MAVKGYDLGQRVLPALGLSADLLFVRADERTLRVGLVDIRGKGPGAAMLAHLAEGILESARPGETPKATMERLNNALERHSCPSAGALLDVTLGTRSVRCVRAGLPELLIFDSATGNHRHHAEGGPPLGFLRDPEFPQASFRLAPSETLVIVSDGITEAAPPGDEGQAQFGYDGILRQLRGKEKATRSAQSLADDIVQAAREFCHDRRDRDDMTAFVLKARPPA